MALKNSDPYARLTEIRRAMGAPSGSMAFDGDPEIPKTNHVLETEGMEVKLSDVVKVGPYLTIRGEILAVLYIFESGASSDDLQNNSPQANIKKFHFTWCKAINEMESAEKIDRYGRPCRMARFKDNRFPIEAREVDGRRHVVNARLFPCQWCLEKIDYHGCAKLKPKQRYQYVEAFNVGEYLDENEGNLTVMRCKPEDLGNHGPRGGYTSAFVQTSNRLRRRAKWICSECGVDMSLMKRGLHAHHVNGVKGDNRDGNLKVLCALCHRAVDQYHAHLRVSNDIERYILAHRPRR